MTLITTNSKRRLMKRLADEWKDAMRQGSFEQAWEISDKSLSSLDPSFTRTLPRHLRSVWNGQPLDGKRVLVRCYHGLGDTIQFIRYAPLLKKIASKVHVWVQPQLIPLLSSVAGIDQLLPLSDGNPEVEFDADVELSELPYVFRTTEATIPGNVPYIVVDAAELPSNNLPHVALIWRAGDWDNSRSIPFAKLKTLLAVPGVNWHILQQDAHSAGYDGLSDWISGGNDPLEDARLIKSMDLVITVDTMTAHLSGAVGARTWTMLPYVSDWRWLVSRTDTPWYPTMRLFRQREAGNWDDVVCEAASELKQFCGRSN